MGPRVRYAPPPIDQRSLSNLVIEKYQSHQSCRDLIETLVAEYVKLWRLVLSYPEHRIVAPGCISAVQRVHQAADRRTYFAQSMDYFGRYVPPRDIAWQGPMDIRGSIDTVRAYHDLHREFPPMEWSDILAVYGARRNSLVVIN
jgi:hypothetical protein